MSANFATIIGTTPTPQEREIPPRFYLGMAALYALVILPYLTVYTSLGWVAISVLWINPIITFVCAAAVASLLLLAIGMGETSRKAMVRLLLVVFVLGVIVDVAEVAVAYVAEGGKIDWQIMQSVPRDYDSQHTVLDVVVAIGLTIGTVVVEECSKLLPVLVLIAFGKIRSMQAGIAAAALAGLTFGLIESNLYGYINLQGMQISEYLMRYFSMSVTHALWDALGAGVAFLFVRNGQPTLRSCFGGFVLTCVLHLSHNALQAIITPTIQAVTICFLLLPVYILTKSARRKSKVVDDFAFEIPIAGFIVLLFTVASAAAMFLPTQTYRTAEQVCEYAHTVNQIAWMLNGKEVDSADSTIKEMSTQDITIPHLRDDLLDALHQVQAQQSLDGADRTYAILLNAVKVSPSMIQSAIVKRRPYLDLDDARHALNGVNAAADLQLPFKRIRRWDITVKSVTLPDAVTKNGGDVELHVLLASGQQLADTLFPAVLSDAFTAHRPLPSWQTSLSLAEDRPIVILYGVDQNAAYVLDASPLPFADFTGELRMPRGCAVNLSVQYDGQ
jgi:hypothetical protein